jgi:hypothetical protein
MGLRAGDRMGSVGIVGVYAARFSHVKIVAEVLDVTAFWRLSPDMREQLLQRFAQAWARLVLAPDPGPLFHPDSSWSKVEAEPYYVHPL